MFPVQAKCTSIHVTFSKTQLVLLVRFRNNHLVQAKRQFVTMHSNFVCKTDALPVQHVKGRTQVRDFWINQINFGKYRNDWGSKNQNDQKLGTGVDKSSIMSCLGDLLGPMSPLGDKGSNKCHFEMNLETAEND